MFLVRSGAVTNSTIGVNLGVFDGILEQRLYKCRPYGALSFFDFHFYIDPVPTGLKRVFWRVQGLCLKPGAVRKPHLPAPEKIRTQQKFYGKF